MNINNFRWRRIAPAIALLVITCSAPTRAWCGGNPSLWASFYSGDIESYSSGQLKKNGAPKPVQLSLTFAGGLAFDKSHNLWVQGGDALSRFTPAQLRKLKKDPSPTAAVNITSTSFIDLGGCAFDSQGNLWVTDFENFSLDELSKAQLDAGTAEVTPAVVITSSDLVDAQFVAFDGSGDAWVGNQDENKIVEFSAGQLTTGGARTPVVVLTSDGSGSIDISGQIAFDKDGNLWVANYGGTVVEFAGSQLGSSGDPTPTVTLSSASFDGPWALTFDSKGDLVVANYNNGSIDKFTPKQIKVSGAPTPSVTITGIQTENGQITFGPAS